MARVSIAKEGKFQQSNSAGYFSLKDDGDKAAVVMLYDDPSGEDLDYHVVHTVQIDGRWKEIDCKAVTEDGEVEADRCPLCQNGYKRAEKLFLQMWNDDAQEVQVWPRGRSYLSKIVGFINRYGSLVTVPFEIERNGRPRDQKTTYEFFPLDREPDNKISDFGQRVELLGRFILDLTEDEMWDVVEGNYHLPNPKSNEGAQRSAGPVRRRGAF